MLTNERRREILETARAVGYKGSVLDLFDAARAGQDISQMLQPQDMQVANTPQEQAQGLRPQHAAGNTNASMAFPDVPPNTPFSTEGMKAPINISKFDEQGHLVQSFKNVPPGIQNLPTGPGKGTVIETPAYKKGGYRAKHQLGGVKRHQTGDFRSLDPRLSSGYNSTDATSVNVDVADPYIANRNEAQRIQDESVPQTISTYEEPSTAAKILNRAANPFTTSGYIERGQQIPDRVPSKENVFDMAADIVNPAAWLDYGIKSYKDFKEGDVVGGVLNALGVVPSIKLVPGIKNAPAKINPRYFKPNSNMYYRGIGKEGMVDALESGVFRARPANQIPARTVDLGSLGKLDMAKRFDKTYYSPQFSIAERYGAGYIAEVPKTSATFSKRYKGSNWSMKTKDQIPISEGQILKKNWWSGYKPVKYQTAGIREQAKDFPKTDLVSKYFINPAYAVALREAERADENAGSPSSRTGKMDDFTAGAINTFLYNDPTTFAAKQEGLQKLRDYTFKNVRPVVYPSVPNYIASMGNAIAGKLGITKGNAPPKRDAEGDYTIDEEMYAKVMNVPHKSKYISESKYKPSKAKDSDAKYYTLDWDEMIDKEKLIDYAAENKLMKGENMVVNSLAPFLKEGYMPEEEFKNIDPLENFTIGLGEDDKGRYLSIYDKYDFNKTFNTVTSPFEIYDRFHLYKLGGDRNKYQTAGQRIKEYTNPDDYNEYLRRSRFYNDSLDAYNVSNQAIAYLDSVFQGTPIKREIDRGKQSMDNTVAYIEGRGEPGLYGLSPADYKRGANKYTEDKTLSYTDLDTDFNLFSPSTISAERFDKSVNVPNYQLLQRSVNRPTGKVNYIFPQGFLSNTDYKNLSPDIIDKITPEDDVPFIRQEVEEYEKRKIRGRDGKLYDYSYVIPTGFASVNTYAKPKVKPIFTGTIPEQPAKSVTPQQSAVVTPMPKKPVEPIMQLTPKSAELGNYTPLELIPPIPPQIYSRKLNQQSGQYMYDTNFGKFNLDRGDQDANFVRTYRTQIDDLRRNRSKYQFGGRQGDTFQEVDTYIRPVQSARPNWAQTPNAVTNYTFGKNLVDDESRFSLGLQGTDILDEIKYRADLIGSAGIGVGNRKGKSFRPAGENLRAGIRGQASWQGVPGNVLENMFPRSGADIRGSFEGEAGLAYANGAVSPYMSVTPQTNFSLNDNLSLGIGYEMRGRYDKNHNNPIYGSTGTGTVAPLSQRDGYSGMGRGAGRLSLKYNMGDGDFIEGYYAKPNTLYQGSMYPVPGVIALENEGPRFGVRLKKSF